MKTRKIGFFNYIAYGSGDFLGGNDSSDCGVATLFLHHVLRSFAH